MAKKAGRPPGSQNKVGKEQKEFIRGLLGETQDEFRQAFLYYAKRAECNADDRATFVEHYTNLTKLIVPKPVDVDLSLDESDFKSLMGLCSKWDDVE